MSMQLKLKMRDCKRFQFKNLDLSNMDLVSLPEELFTFTFLEELDLSNNLLPLLDDRLLLLENLKKLNLRDNQIESLDLTSWKSSKLQTLHLEGNPIEGHSKNALRETSFTQLQQLLKPIRKLNSLDDDFFEQKQESKSDF